MGSLTQLSTKFHRENGANMMNRTLIGLRFYGILATSLAISAVAASQAKADAKVYSESLHSTTWVLTKVGGKTSSGTGVLVDFRWVHVFTLRSGRIVEFEEPADVSALVEAYREAAQRQSPAATKPAQ